MLRGHLTGRMRRLSIWSLGGVLTLLSVFTVQQATSLEEESATQRETQTVQELTNLVSLWEGLITDRIRSWTTESTETASAEREQRLRATVHWFDASYRWTSNGELQWPQSSRESVIAEQLDEPCLSSANSLRITGKAESAAAAFEACELATPQLQLTASYLAAKVRLEAGLHQKAYNGLLQSKPELGLSLTRATDQGLDVRLLIQRRLQALQALDHLGREDASADLTLRTIQAISSLPAPDLATHLALAEELLSELSASNPGQAEAAEQVARAQRRLVAFEALQSRLIGESRHATPGAIHIVQDLYSEPGFLLIWSALDERRRVAVQVDARDLLRSFQDTLPPSTGVHIVDARGYPLGPDGRVQSDKPPVRVSTSVGLGRIFPHLQIVNASVGLPRRGPIERVLLPLAPLGVSLALGLLAVWAQLTADRRETDLNHRQQEFITRVTHELKTPLAGIRVMAETLQLGAADDPRTRDQFLDRILNECNNLSARIDEVLNAARRPQIKNIVEVSASDLVRSVVERWEPRFTQADARLEAQLGDTPPISVDIDLVRDAIGNLLDNALKYRRTGIPGVCRVRTGATGRWVMIEVCDNGIGVPADKRSAVFERFTRVEGHGRGKAGGHGLGLSFVADTAAAHSGLVECVSGFDGGACFRIKFPRR